MKKILLPNGLHVSEVALGAMMFGSSTSKKEAYEILDAYLDMGGNFIDTSNNYAHWLGTGDESETLIGEWIKERNCRDCIVLATKVGFDRHGKGAGLKKEQIEYWIDEKIEFKEIGESTYTKYGTILERFFPEDEPFCSIDIGEINNSILERFIKRDHCKKKSDQTRLQ